jgi:hypothetical protein
MKGEWKGWNSGRRKGLGMEKMEEMGRGMVN